MTSAKTHNFRYGPLVSHNNLNAMLLNIAIQSAKLRVDGHLHEPAGRRSCLEKEVAEAMETLGAFCRDIGHDAKASPFWPLLEKRSSYVMQYENGRLIQLAELSWQAILTGIRAQNILRWNSWEIAVGNIFRNTGAHGQETLIWVSSEEGTIEAFWGTSAKTAHDICDFIHDTAKRSSKPVAATELVDAQLIAKLSLHGMLSAFVE
jgi:hypothetical protein